MKVDITLEKTIRVSKEYDVTEEEFKQLKAGINPFHEEMEKEIESGYVEYNYAVCDENGETLIDWA